MIDVDKLKKYREKYEAETSRLSRSLTGFIIFISNEQAKNKKSSVISLEMRETSRRAKEMAEKIKENKALTPEDDFKTLKK